MTNEIPFKNEQVTSFVNMLKNELPDTRDNRGKRHTLAFVVVAFVLATLTGRQKLSSIHRHICNRLYWLHELTQIQTTRPISRAHLPRLLSGLDWAVLDKLIERCFGVRIQQNEEQKWVAIDGKTLRGTLDGGDKQSLVLAVAHESGEVVGQARQVGSKSSEIPVVRTLLKETGLEKQKVSLDAHHCNPETTSQIHKAGGIYLTQVKENQEVLLQQCKALDASQPPLAEIIEHDKANGRVTTRRAQLFSMVSLSLAPRWMDSALSACLIVERETFELAKQKTTVDTSYYVSNQVISASTIQATAKELTQAVRRHWGVESGNWIRDVTFGEDLVKTKVANQAQIMGRLRSLSIALLRKTKVKNFQAAIEKFVDSASALESMLRQVNFL
jgi:predicted transposase YbfD/YdcC